MRLARADEAAEIPRVEREAATMYAPWGLDEALAESTTPVDRVERAIARGELFVALEEERVVGYLLFALEEDELHIEELAVMPSVGRRGAGSALLAAVIDVARMAGAARITLVTLAFATFATSFYEARGFVQLEPAALGPRLRALAPPEEKDGRVVYVHALA